MATLLLILIAFMLALVLCLNPRRRRREGALLELDPACSIFCSICSKRARGSSAWTCAALELSARQQREEEQRKLEEETNFTPKRTQLPVIIIMPTGECEYGRKISVECLDKEAAEKAAGISSRTNDLEHPEDKPTSYYLRGNATVSKCIQSMTHTRPFCRCATVKSICVHAELAGFVEGANSDIVAAGKHPHYFEAHVQPCKKPEET